MSSKRYLSPSEYSNFEHTCSDRTPYCYLIGWSSLNVFYYGKRTAKDCHPSEFWVTYFTSSKVVKHYVDMYGSPDIMQIRKIFTDVKSCSEWEIKVIRRIIKTKKFLNLQYSSSKFDATYHVAVKDIYGNSFLIKKDDPKLYSGEVYPDSFGVKLKKVNGKFIRIESEKSPDELAKEYHKFINDIITVIDIKTNNLVQIKQKDFDKTKYKKIEGCPKGTKLKDSVKQNLKISLTGKILAKTKDGIVVGFVSTDDERLISGELVKHNKFIDDPEYAMKLSIEGTNKRTLLLKREIVSKIRNAAKAKGIKLPKNWGARKDLSEFMYILD